ncbi:MAG: hypothetical protein JWN48_6099 [Myxococcaceae bacterium]|nr:hypothetical protein [Myxococcaceae bacterium]
MANIRSLLALLGLSLSAFGCTYDLDPIYDHVSVDAGPSLPRSTQLIQSWIGTHPLVDQGCVTCAEANCAEADTACHGDQTCLDYTKCVGAAPNPAGQSACRAKYSAWVRDPKYVRDRDQNGPYGQCVFRYKCQVACSGNADLSCLGGFTWSTTPDPSVPLHLFVVDASDQTKVQANVKVRVCAANDVKCDSPTAQGTTDANGLVELALPTTYVGAFTGYLEVIGAGLYPTLLKFSWNIGQETTYLVGIVNESLFKLSISGLQTPQDDTRGMLQLRMLGCAGIGTKGVSFSASLMDTKSSTWYIDGVIPKFDALSTNEVGSGGIINVPAGTTDVTATRASDGMLVAKTAAPVRASFMTVVVFEPQGSGQ